MRILVDAHIFDKSFQGSRTYIQGLYLALIEKRPEWHFYFVAQNLNTLKQVFGESPNIHYLKLNKGNKYFRLAWELPKLIRRNNIDFAHFQYITPIFKASKYIVTTHDILFEEERFKHFFPFKYRLINGALFKRSAKLADVLATVSEYSKQQLHQIYNIPTSSIYVTPNAVEKVNSQKKTNYIKEKFGCENYILYVSRIEPRKNHLTLLKSFVNLKLHEQGYQLVFIGSLDIESDAMQAFIEANKAILENRVHYFSNIGGEDLHQFYFNCKLFVYPSFAEGFGIPPLEAALHHVPVVCSNATAMSEFNFFKHHVNPNHQEEVDDAILNALNGDVDHLTEVNSDIQKRFNWKISAEVLEKAIISNSKA